MPSKHDNDYAGFASVRFTVELKAKIKQLAKEEDRSFSNMVEVLCKRALKAQDVPKQ